MSSTPLRIEAFLETALEATTDAVYMKDADGRYLLVNQATAAVFGCTPEAAVGRIDADFFEPEQAAALTAMDRQVLASGETITCEESMVTSCGPRTFQSTKGIYRDGDGKPAGIFGISRDITDRRRIEGDRHRFQQALELTVEGVSHLDLEGRFLWVNDAFARLCGYTPGHMVGLSWAILAHPDDVDRLAAAHAGLTFGGRIETEIRSVRPDGSWFQAQLVVVAAKDAAGVNCGFYSTLRDVTDRKLAEETLNHAAAELERINGELESFAFLAAHDLRQPLQVIGGFAQLLAESQGGQADQRSDRYLDAIGRGVATMTAMVDSLLEFAEARGSCAPEGLTDSGRVVAEVIDGLRGSMDGARVIVHGRLPVLPADPGQLTRLFQNLIGNGIKFRREVAPLVQVAAERDGAYWRFTVQDDGIGVSPEFAGRMFGMFERERRGNHPGTGMGLAICRKIVEHHGGLLSFEAAPRQGSIFSFTLPAERPAG
jgi:PAS domain S-box-containing protein